MHYVPEESYDESCTIIQLPVGGLRLLIMRRRRILSRFGKSSSPMHVNEDVAGKLVLEPITAA